MSGSSLIVAIVTRKLIEAGDKLAIKAHDHIIVGRNGHASFRALMLI